MRALIALLSGALFGLGLIVSDMVNPARVLGFLDVAGAWDPTLAFVMAGALAPMAIAWRVAARRSAPACGGAFPTRSTTRPGLRMVAGAALFGAGWGLVGFCPGPALAAVGTGNGVAATFVLAMVIGMWAQSQLLPQARAA
jgi:uncharacterized membrane protein YedE/YeeE